MCLFLKLYAFIGSNIDEKHFIGNSSVREKKNMNFQFLFIYAETNIVKMKFFAEREKIFSFFHFPFMFFSGMNWYIETRRKFDICEFGVVHK